MPITRFMTLLSLYLLVLLAVFFLQRHMIYFPERYNSGQYRQLLTSLNLKTWPSENNFHAIVSDMPLSAVKGTVVVFHGNAGSAVHRTYYIEALQHLGYRVIIAEYPGYGGRPGTPSEAELIKDGIKIIKLAWKAYHEPLFLCGESLGSGVVSGIVASNAAPIKGLLLITPFDALANVAQHHYWFFFAKWLLRDKFNNVRNLSKFTGNTAFILAGQDEIIPEASTMALFKVLSGPKKLWRFEQSGHNTLPLAATNAWWQEAMLFIDRG